MSTSYPNAFDNLASPLDSESQAIAHGANHRNANDSIEAIQTELGLNPKGVSPSVAARLSAIESSIVTVGQTAATALAPASVTNAKMAVASIDTAQLVDNSITAGKLQSDAVTTAKVQNLAITTAKLADGAVTASKLSGVALNAAGLIGARPASPSIGAIYYDTGNLRSYVYDGGGWVVMSEPTQSTSPGFGGITGGSPSTLGTSHRQDGWCDFTATLTFGSTPSAMASVILVLPYTAVNVQRGQFSVNFLDNTVLQYPGTHDPGTTTVVLYPLDAASTYSRNAAATNLTSPFTWGVGDAIVVSGRFQMASRYS